MNRAPTMPYNDCVAAGETTVIIINWNGAAFLDQLLESIQGETTIVVDNASNDDSLGIIGNRAHVIRNSENLGYGSAANQAIEICTTPFLLLLNVDVKILPGAIATMERYLEDHPDVAIVAPRLLFPDGRLQASIRSFPTAKSIALYLSYLDRIFHSGYRKKPEEHRHSQEIDQPMGAAMMLRKSVVDEIGGFDPRFFLYMEEVDLCFRMKQKGYKIAYVPEAEVIHHSGGSSRQDWERAQSQFLRSVHLYFEKHDPEQERRLKRLLPPALIFRSLILLCMGRFREAKFWFQNAITETQSR